MHAGARARASSFLNMLQSVLLNAQIAYTDAQARERGRLRNRAKMASNLPGADDPIASADQDLLNRAPLAKLIAEQVRELDATTGAVIGILGPWGVGKTSLLNMIAEQLKRESALSVLEFNPWLFSSTEELVHTFFHEIATQLRLKTNRLPQVADDLEAYGKALSPLRFIPVVGPWLDRLGTVGRIVGGVLKRHGSEEPGVVALRDRLTENLACIGSPVVVLIDDLDRLSTEGIRGIFKLVRLTGNFPNIVYMLAFDRHRVEKALTENGVEGRAYLEKILQFAYEIPPVSDELLRNLFLERLEEVLSPLPTGPFDAQLWPDVFAECIWPFINNLRDAKRYLAALPVTVRHLGENVALVDVLAAEAVRQFRPDVHRLFPEVAGALTDTRDLRRTGDRAAAHKESVERFIAAGGSDAEVIRACCLRLFPATGRYLGEASYGPGWLARWKRERRLAHPDILAYYIDRVPSLSLRAARWAERAFEKLSNEAEFRAVLEPLPSEELEATIGELEGYEDEYPPEAVEPACRVLLNMLPRVREGRRGTFDFGAELVVRRVVLRLLRRLEDEVELWETVRRLFETVDTLNSRFVLVAMVGHEENVGHELISKEQASALEAELRREIVGAPAEELVQERQLLRLLWWYGHEQEDVEEVPRIQALESGVVQEALFRDAVRQTYSQTMGSRAVRSRARLDWELLVEVLGGEEQVEEAIEQIQCDEADEELRAALDLVERYLTGWVPPEHGLRS